MRGFNFDRIFVQVHETKPSMIGVTAFELRECCAELSSKQWRVAPASRYYRQGPRVSFQVESRLRVHVSILRKPYRLESSRIRSRFLDCCSYHVPAAAEGTLVIGMDSNGLSWTDEAWIVGWLRWKHTLCIYTYTYISRRRM